MSSILFYFWGEKQYTVLVLASVFFNYIMGVAIARQKAPVKELLVGTAVMLNLTVLFYYKYFGFFLQNIAGGSDMAINARGIHLPLGISFFTFHGLTYVIDIYRKDAQLSYNPLTVGLYTLFFPQLVAGPIVRYKDIDEQLSHRTTSSERLYDGLRRFVIGFAKKLIIADTMGSMANQIYGMAPIHTSTQMLWLAALCYTLQIYFDFSGYSDMAIGLARIFGFDFLENFNFPYSATSIKDFWRRWHISLSNFFRDYVYIPLGGSRKGKFRTYLNLLTVFFLTGFWHGASWNYLIWGMYHGTFLVMERLFLDKVLARLPKLLQHAYALFIVLVGWVFFRLEDWLSLKTALRKMFFLDRFHLHVYSLRFFLTNYNLTVLLAGILFSFPVWQWLRSKIRLNPQNLALRVGYDCGLLLLFLVSLSIMASSTFSHFIYFRF